MLGGPHLAAVSPSIRSHRCTLVDAVKTRGGEFVVTSISTAICAFDSQPCTSALLWRSAVATDSNFGLEERRRGDQKFRLSERSEFLNFPRVEYCRCLPAGPVVRVAIVLRHSNARPSKTKQRQRRQKHSKKHFTNQICQQSKYSLIRQLHNQ